jgi:hypothetical protein
MDTDGLEHSLNDEADCCDSPQLELSDWKCDKENGQWRFDAICYNCWDTSYGKIKAVDVTFDG